MYPRFVFALLFSVCAIQLGVAIPASPVDERCGSNAEYRECGPACAPSCKNPRPPIFCSLRCITGCFCKDGFMKNEKGECVRANECDGKTHPKIPFQIPYRSFPICPDNEEFLECGSACAPTCAHPQPSAFCTKNCVVGCFCKEGHLRNANGVCVPAAKCDAPEPLALFAYPPEVSQCKDNELFLTCGSACEPTCANPHPSICTQQCVIGCFCKPGFLKNEQGVCVPSEKCGVPASEATPMPAPVCSENEEFRQCRGCDGTCDNPNPLCPRICVPGCACKHGHLRSGSNGKCIPKEQCSKPTIQSLVMMPPRARCGEHQVFLTCGSPCAPTCDNPHPSPVCIRKCEIGCFCEEGYLKNAEGKCVPAANCEAKPAVSTPKPEAKCPTDREMHVEECGSQMDCMATCHMPPPFLIHGYPQVSKKCSERTCAPSCVCKHPYVRNADGQCVERKECDKTPSH